MKRLTSLNPALQLILILSVSLTGAIPGAGAAPTITIHAGQPGAKINPAMWGVFFEDINFGADGGLYAELVKNRGFEFPDPLMGWIKITPSLARAKCPFATTSRSTPAIRIMSASNPKPAPRSAFPTKAFAAWACARARPTIFPRRSRH